MTTAPNFSLLFSARIFSGRIFSARKFFVRSRQAVKPRIHQPKILALALTACFATLGPAHANPINPTVVSGQASFDQQGNTLIVTNSPNSMINWQSFSIDSGETTHFNQQSPSSAVLNRITGGDPSNILGTLSSNGRVFLMNPNGITFGAGSVINVAGLVASSLNLSDADFLNGRKKFTANTHAGTINNQGAITTPTGGSVYLIAPKVENHGIITTPQGEILLAAGNSVELVNPGSPDVRVDITATDNQALNVGSLIAQSGRIGIYAGLINQHGVANANSVGVNAAGQIIFKATQDTLLGAGSSTTATSPTGTGGMIQVLGNRVGLLGNAAVDASGENGGGTVLIGGDFQGNNPTVQNAQATFIDSAATIKADAINAGNGGKAIVWADGNTQFYGSISARGGRQSGNGGLMEVSGKNNLVFRGRADAAAPMGKAGTLLLDPKNIVIDSAAQSIITLLPNLLPFADTTSLTTITPKLITDITSGGTAVVLQANNDIQLAANSNIITATATGIGGDITLQAGRSILIGSNISTAGGNLKLSANENAAVLTPSPVAGVINVQRDAGSAEIKMAAGTTLDTGTGNISITIGQGVGLTEGVAGQLNGTSGNITLANLATTGLVSVHNNGLTPGSNIVRASDSSLIKAGSAEFTASNGVIGSAAAPLRVALTYLEASASHGLHFNSPTQGLTIGFPVLDRVPVGFHTVNGDINVSAAGSITVQSNISILGTGNINLAARGATSDLVFDIGVVSTSAGGGNIALSAGSDIEFNSGHLGMFGSNINISAGNNFSYHSTSTLSATGLFKARIGNNMLFTAGGISGSGIDIVTGNNLALVADQTGILFSSSGHAHYLVGGSLILQGGGGAGASAIISGLSPASGQALIAATTAPSPQIAVRGDVVLRGGSGIGATAEIFNAQEISMLIGGTIRLIEGTGISVSGGAARIVSLADIHLNFVDGRSSGYVVNGVEGAISSGATGFFSGQNAQQIFTPAILGSTLLVSYSDDSIRDVLRATLREHREDSDNENLMREDDEDEDKKRPVCRGT